MATRTLSSDWLARWRPTKRTELGDRDVRGLRVRGGPSGVVTFWTYTREADPGTGRLRRKGINLGRWSEAGGPGTVTLPEARAAVVARRERKVEAPRIGGTVEALALAYKRDRLAGQERGSEEWNTVRVHIIEARPDSARPVFGEWPAPSVERQDLAAVVRLAKRRRLAGSRWQGGPGAARAVLRDLNAIFAHGVDAGLLKTNPAGMKADTFGLRKTGRARYLDAGELAAFFQALDLNALLDGTARKQKLSEAVRLGIAFQAYVPPRTQGIIGARWEEFDLAGADGATWLIPPARQKVKNAAERAQARAFAVPLCPTAVAILRRLQDLAPKSPYVLASPRKPDRPVNRKALVRALARLQASGRLAFGSRVTVHDLRRGWRSMAGDLGVSFEVAEACLGHKLPGVAGVYMRGEMVTRRREATDLVGAALDRIRLGKAAAVVPIAERAVGHKG
jgi:hypothetical protein